MATYIPRPVQAAVGACAPSSTVQQVPLAAMCRLIAYAIDAKRVLDDLYAFASGQPEFGVAARSACADWLNPDCEGHLSKDLWLTQCFVAEEIERVARIIEEVAS